MLKSFHPRFLSLFEQGPRGCIPFNFVVSSGAKGSNVEDIARAMLGDPSEVIHCNLLQAKGAYEVNQG